MNFKLSIKDKSQFIEEKLNINTIRDLSFKTWEQILVGKQKEIYAIFGTRPCILKAAIFKANNRKLHIDIRNRSKQVLDDCRCDMQFIKLMIAVTAYYDT